MLIQFAMQQQQSLIRSDRYSVWGTRKMKIKVKIISTVAAVVTLGFTAPIVMSSDSVDGQARVLKSTERYVTVRELRPTEQCREVVVEGRSGSTSSDTPELLGAVIGGAIGKNISDSGDKDGKTGAIIGSLLGASIASDIEKKNAQNKRTSSRTEVRCTTVQREVEVQRIDGYNVTYEYQGDIFTSQMSSRPGSTIPVRVYVLPVE